MSRRNSSKCRGHNGILEVCEIFILGEFRCPNDWYGPVCERYCPGCRRDLCDPDWGCLKGCKEGWIGLWCDIRKPVLKMEIVPSSYDDQVKMDCVSPVHLNKMLTHTFKRDQSAIKKAVNLKESTFIELVRNLKPWEATYTCEVTSAWETFASPGVRLVFSATIHQSGPLTVLSGTEKTFTCTMGTLKHTNVYSTTFYKDIRKYTISQAGNTLHLSTTTTSDSGLYSCGVEGNGFLSTRSLPLKINFVDKPIMNIKFTRPVYDIQMDMHCTTACDTGVNLTYTFRRYGEVIMEATNVTDSTFSVLAINLRTFLNGSYPLEGNFTCEVTAGGETFVSDVFILSSNYSTPVNDDMCFFKHGPLCEFFCAQECAGLGDCDSRTEECREGCKPGFLPPTCTNRCPPGKFGLNCSKTCFYCTSNQTTYHHYCDHITGKCLNGCGPGYHDKYCEKIVITQGLSFQPETILKYALIVVAVIVLLFWKYRFLHVFASTISTSTSDHVEIVVRDRVVTQTAVSEYIQDTPVDPDSSVDPVGRGNYVKFQSAVDPVTKHIKFSVAAPNASSVDPIRARQKKISIFQKAPKPKEPKEPKAINSPLV